MLALAVKKTWMGAAFIIDTVATVLTFHVLPPWIQAYSIFAFGMDVYVLIREFLYGPSNRNQIPRVHTPSLPYLLT